MKQHHSNIKRKGRTLLLMDVALLLLVGIIAQQLHAKTGDTGATATASTYATITIPPALEISDNRDAVIETILQKASEALIDRGLETETSRFNLAPRWVPNRIAQLQPGQIRSVTPKTGDIREYTLFDVLTPSGIVEIQLQITLTRKIPVASTRLISGSQPETSQFVMEWVDVTRLQHDYVTEMHQLDGMQLRRTLLAGQPVRQSDIWTPPAVAAGDVVTLVFATEFMQITIPATARQDGQTGDVIRIYSSETRKTYLAEVNGPGEVLWKQTL
ncbi:MAG: flagellar basal body P-ring formation protein FlgA [Bacteroidetes bacterium]|nr:flagellar basal body P-ring formation protein FlgA [Bacteroidota bacterium]